MSTINYTYNVIVDRFRQFAAGHFQLRRFTHGEISQADLEKEAEWPWLHVKPRAINYSPGTRSFSFEIFISDLPRDKEDKTGYQAESITDCSLIFQDLINEIYLGNMFGSDVVLTRPVNSEPFVEQYTHTLTGVTGTIELNLDYDWSACSIPASWNYNTPTDSPSDGWGALQFIESLDQNGVFVSLLNDVEAPGNSYYYGTNSSGVKGWYAIVDNVGLTCETLPDCATIISIVDDIAALESGKVDKVAGKGLSTEDYTTAEKSKLAGIQAGAEVNVNADWNAVSGDAQILNKPTIPSIAGLVPETRTLTINGTTQDLSADRTFSVGTFNLPSLTSGSVLFSNGTTIAQDNTNLFWDDTNNRLGIGTATPATSLDVRTAGQGYVTIGGADGRTISSFNNAGVAAVLNFGAANFNGFMYGSSWFDTSTNTQSVRLSSTTVSLWSASTERLRVANNGNILIGTTTDAGYKLDVNGSVRTTGSISAASAIARGTYLNQTLVATANNDVLVGLDIQPTFTTGAFTGVQSIALRLPNGGRITNAGTGSGYNVYIATTETTLNSPTSTGTIGFQLNYGFVGRFMGTTGNFILQNGGTFTDAGYRLDVNGTSRFQGHIYQGSGHSIISIGNTVNLRSNLIGGSGYVVDAQSYNTLNSTSNEQGFAQFTGTYAPTSVSGTPSFNALKLTPTINQTGGANQITRGLFINPTLTAAADFRAIEVTNGITILGAATTAKASLRIPSGTAPTSPVNGDIWFDGTDIKMQIGGVTKTFTLV